MKNETFLIKIMPAMNKKSQISSNPLKIVTYIRHIPNFLKLIYRLYKDPRIGFTSRLYLWGGGLYFISPFDFIPDFLIPGLGYAEDIVIMYFLMKAFLKSCPAEVVWEHVKRIEDEDPSFKININRFGRN